MGLWRSMAAMLVAGMLALGQDGDEGRRNLASSGPVELRGKPVTVALQSVEETKLARALGELKRDERVYLVIRELQTDRAPGVVYNVYLDLPPNTPPQQAQEFYAGHFNFFNVRPGVKDGRPVFASFDVTEAVRRMARKGVEKLSVTLMPGGTLAAESHPVVGRMELVVVRK